MGINVWTGVGRLTKDPDTKVTQGGKTVTRFTLAVDGYKKGEADFINCIAWEKTGDIIAQYCNKGSQLGVSGRLKTGSYDKPDGTKVYTTDVIVSEFQFLGSKQDKPNTEGFSDLTPVDDDSIPF